MSVIYDIISEYIIENKVVFFLYLCLTLILNFITTIVIPKTISLFMESSLNKKDVFGENIQKTLLSFSKMGILYVLGGIFTITTIIICLKDYIEKIDVVSKTTNYFKKTILKKIFEKYSKHFKEIPESDILWIVENSFSSVKIFILYIFSRCIPFFLSLIIISIYLYTISIPIFLIFLIQMIIVISLLFLNHSSYLSNTIKVERTVVQNSNFINDKVKNLMNIIFDNLIQKEIDEIDEKEDILMKRLIKTFVTQTFIVFLINIISYISLFIIFYKLMFKERNIIYTVIIILLLYKNIQDEFIYETLGEYYNISKFVKMNEIVESIDEKIVCKPIKPFYSIKLNNVSYKYDEKSNYILKNVNIHFEHKKINVITGKSGSGKTTIMKLIVKLYKPTKGSIQYDELNSVDICETDVRENIYYVNQRTILFEESVLYNLQYGNDTTKEDVIKLLETYDLLDYYSPLEFGIESNSGVNGSHLSLGMQKIIMVVRGILKPNKGVLILDEPLSSLDKETRQKIVNMIVHETKNKTVIAISHDPEILPYADNVIHLQRKEKE